MSNKRIEFKAGVPELLFRQADARCSFPRCTRPTTGPFISMGGAVNMGSACHIYSAAPDGPRGRGGRDKAFISSQANGIWCCSYHAGLIDKRDGYDYPASVLFSWKALAEARCLKRMNDTPSPLGWVDRMEVTDFAPLEILPNLELSRYTLLWGENDSGKTVLLQAAASISAAKHADRFTTYSQDSGGAPNVRMASRVSYSTVDTLSKEVDLEIRGLDVTRRQGVIPYLLPPGDIAIIYCSSSELTMLDSEDDIDCLMRVIDVDRSALYALCKHNHDALMPGDTEFRIGVISDDDTGEELTRRKPNSGPFMEIWFRKHPRDFHVSYRGLSTSERGEFILDLLIRKARELCKERLTILLIDSLCINFQQVKFKNLLSRLVKENFQSLVHIPPVAEQSVLVYSDGRAVFKDGKPVLLDAEFLSQWRLVTTPIRATRASV